MSEHKYINKLIKEKSPYVLQHAHNPVDWYPLGAGVFSRAVSEDIYYLYNQYQKLIFPS
jgi:uncharacterized protein YyaL (SSP411 family)